MSGVLATLTLLSAAGIASVTLMLWWPAIRS
jgi:hypothetical protein